MVLRKLKFILNRNNLDKLYVTYILPLLEYACEIWDGFCSRDADKLEQLQFEASRIIYILGCQNLQARNRYTLKPVVRLTLFHKIHNNIAPEYLQDCLNEYLVVNNYNLRNSLQYRVPRCRLETFSKSFFPSTIRWIRILNLYKLLQSLSKL